MAVSLRQWWASRTSPWLIFAAPVLCVALQLLLRNAVWASPAGEPMALAALVPVVTLLSVLTAIAPGDELAERLAARGLVAHRLVTIGGAVALNVGSATLSAWWSLAPYGPGAAARSSLLVSLLAMAGASIVGVRWAWLFVMAPFMLVLSQVSGFVEPARWSLVTLPSEPWHVWGALAVAVVALLSVASGPVVTDRSLRWPRLFTG